MSNKPKVPEIFHEAMFEHEDDIYLDAEEAAEIAQRLFAEWLESQTVVYGKDSLHGFDVKASPTDTYAAYLVSPTELKKEPCEHVPHVASKQVVPHVRPETSLMLGCRITCVNCGVELEATGWKEVSE